MTVATNDAFRNVNVVQPTTPDPTVTTVSAEAVGDTLTITAGLGITITADPNSDNIIITNTGNGTGAYTEIADSNANLTFYPLFSRPFLPTDINELDTPPSYQLDAIYVDNTTSPMTYNPSTGTLTTLAVAANLTGNVTGDVSGNAGTVTNGVYTNGSYSDPTWLTISATKVGLGNVTNESKATMFSNPTFTGTVAGVTSTHVGLGNVENTALSTSTHYIGTTSITYNRASASQTLTGVSIDGNAGTATNGVVTTGSYSDPSWLTISATKVGLGNVENTALSTSTHYIGTTSITYNRASASQTLTGVDIDGNAATATNGVVTTGSYSDPSWLTISQTKVGLGNVTNESKATMFTSPTFTGTTTFQEITEVMSPKTGATGVVAHDFSTAAIFYHTSPAANFTANITNMPTTTNRVSTVSIIITQGGTGYYPNVLQIDGVGQTINWVGNVTPTPSVNRNDVVSFTMIRTATPAWIVIGSITGY